MGGAPPNLYNETSDLPLNFQQERELLHLMLEESSPQIIRGTRRAFSRRKLRYLLVPLNIQKNEETSLLARTDKAPPRHQKQCLSSLPLTIEKH